MFASLEPQDSTLILRYPFTLAMTEAARARLETFYARYERIHSRPLTVQRKAYSSDPKHHVRALSDEPPRYVPATEPPREREEER